MKSLASDLWRALEGRAPSVPITRGRHSGRPSIEILVPKACPPRWVALGNRNARRQKQTPLLAPADLRNAFRIVVQQGAHYFLSHAPSPFSQMPSPERSRDRRKNVRL